MPHILNGWRVAHFGCSTGSETIAIAWLLNSPESVGLDIKDAVVFEAKSGLESLRKVNLDISFYISTYFENLYEDEKSWWAEIPTFFKDRSISDDLLIDFRVQDVSHPSPLLPKHDDLSFSNFILHHIWFREGDPEVFEFTSSAIHKLVRIIKPGGYLAAHELIQYGNSSLFDFTFLFAPHNLREVHIRTTKSDDGTVAEYI